MRFIGIDSHKDTLAAASIDAQGRPLGSQTFANEAGGFVRLIDWARAVEPERIGIEGSGGLGRQAALALQAAAFAVVEVPPQLTAAARRNQRNHSKTDPIDALIIARIVLRDEDLPTVRPTGEIEDLRALVRYRRDLLAERTRLASQLHGNLEQLHPGYQRSIGRLTTLTELDKVKRLLATDASVGARLARQRLARLRQLCKEIVAATREVEAAVSGTAVQLQTIPGVAKLAAAEILAHVGDVRRFRTKAQFAMANGTAPLPASSGRTNRHRLNRGGNRQLNRVIHFAALTQVARYPEGRAYYLRKQAEGRSKKDALRCLKRRISDRIYHSLRLDAGTA